MESREKYIINIFRAIRKLQRGCSMKDLNYSLGVSEKSAYRYKSTIEELGFKLEKNPYNHRYKIIGKSDLKVDLTFSQEEVDFIVGHLPVHETLVERIKDKLYIYSDIQAVPNRWMEVEFGKNVHGLQEAIDQSKRVELKGYSSAHTNQQTDILVEPIKMEDHYQRLYAYNPAKQKMYQYKTERIEEVDVLEQKQQFTHRHPKEIRTDLFWWVFEEESHSIRLELTRGAYHMVREEFPRIQACTREKKEGLFELKAEVASLKAVSSLILRYPGEIRVVSPRELEEFTARRLAELPFLKKYFKPLSQNDNSDR